jgi:hypothetical protein
MTAPTLQPTSMSTATKATRRRKWPIDAGVSRAANRASGIEGNASGAISARLSTPNPIVFE